MTTELINRLTDELKPWCPACPYDISIRMLLVAALGTALLLAIIGLRPDIATAVTTLFPYWKSGMFIMMGVGALTTGCRLGLPGRGVGLFGPAMVIFGITGIFAFTIGAMATQPDIRFSNLGTNSSMLCLTSVLGLGTILMIVTMFVMRRLAYMRPVAGGMMIGLASGALAAGAYAWHCITADPLYVATWYMLPVVILAIVGALIGRRILRM